MAQGDVTSGDFIERSMVRCLYNKHTSGSEYHVFICQALPGHVPKTPKTLPCVFAQFSLVVDHAHKCILWSSLQHGHALQPREGWKPDNSFGVMINLGSKRIRITPGQKRPKADTSERSGGEFFSAFCLFQLPETERGTLSHYMYPTAKYHGNLVKRMMFYCFLGLLEVVLRHEISKRPTMSC